MHPCSLKINLNYNSQLREFIGITFMTLITQEIKKNMVQRYAKDGEPFGTEPFLHVSSVLECCMLYS